ncbi:MAG: hypothetical protein FD180_2738 [Planctomycetota bacterium]|nr:MAG: hypothetical protein FD180_2738 [Planctomycetota bacterium]
MSRTSIAAFCLLATSITPCAAGGLLDLNGKSIDDFIIDVEGRYWFATLSGDLSVDENDVDGTSADFHGDLNFDRPEQPLLEGVARLRLWRVQLRGAYFQAHFEDRRRLESSITFLGFTFTTGRDVDAEATVRVGALDANFLIIDEGSADKIGFELGAGVGGRYLGFEGSLRDRETGQEESVDERAGIPVVSAYASLGFLNVFRIDAEVAGMYLPSSYPRLHGKFIDASIEARIYLHHFVYLAGGYRFVLLKGQYDSDDDVDVDARLQGFFAGIGVSF